MSDDGKLVAAGANSDEDGRIVGAADGCEVIVWNVDDNSEVTRLMWTDAKISRVAFGPDGTTLAAALRHDRLGSVSGSVQLWDLATGTQTFSHDFNEGIADLQFDSTGRLLACGLGSRVTFLVPVERDFTVAIVSLESRGVIHMLRGHHGIVTSVSFSADGRRVASASWDKSVKIWDTSTGEETLTLRGHAAPVDAVAFSSDGRRIYSADWDGIVKIWEAR
jgi:WD40 repeat protein